MMEGPIEEHPIYNMLVEAWYDHIESITVEQVYEGRALIIDDMENNSALPPIQTWPKTIRAIFFDPQLPQSLVNMSALYAFLYGNGYCPNKTAEWLLTYSGLDAKRKFKVEKRAEAIARLHDKTTSPYNEGTYYDVRLIKEERLTNFEMLCDDDLTYEDICGLDEKSGFVIKRNKNLVNNKL
jgi:hypothetical protein